MTYQVLARKWRPRSFAEMVGQEHVLRALANGLANGRLHHAYLFSGTRGVGKTTVARILAKCLNCETHGVTDVPCGECSACTDIDAGRFVDLIEVDAASRTKVEDTRDLLDNVQYAPTRGRFKIYLIDEVHMLSTHSFNALLKTLEEPPAHVKFLLATTDPQRLPVTVLSRCLQFNLKPLLPKPIVDHLGRIAEAEGVSAEPAALQRLATAAAGSLRDALSLTDQALAFGAGALRDAEVRDMLGTLPQEHLCELLECLADGDGAELLAAVERLAEASPDFDEALSELLAVLHQLTLAETVPEVFDQETPQSQRLAQIVGRFDGPGLQLLYDIAIRGRRDLALAPDPRTGFEMTLLRMLAFQPEAGAADGSPPPAVKSSTARSSAAAPSGPQASAVAEAAESAEPASAEPVPAEADRTEPAPAEADPTEPVPAEADSAEPAPAEAAGAKPASAEAVDWHALVEALGVTGMARALADHCEWVGQEGDRIRLAIDEGHAHLVNPTTQTRLAKALAKRFGDGLRIDIQVGAAGGDTPAAAAERVENERQAKARAAIESDPNIQALRDTFGAEVISESIRPKQ